MSDQRCSRKKRLYGGYKDCGGYKELFRRYTAYIPSVSSLSQAIIYNHFVNCYKTIQTWTVWMNKIVEYIVLFIIMYIVSISQNEIIALITNPLDLPLVQAKSNSLVNSRVISNSRQMHPRNYYLVKDLVLQIQRYSVFQIQSSISSFLWRCRPIDVLLIHIDRLFLWSKRNICINTLLTFLLSRENFKTFYWYIFINIWYFHV